MKVRVAIIGLPNVGKSTLFNALAKQSIAAAENFPFCTIDPNITPVEMPDKYLKPLAQQAKSKRAVSVKIEFVDVAGLVKGASKGEGLGNRFLATVRECDAIIHVLRNYIDNDIVHVDGRVDPILDAEVVNLELLLADEAHIERRLEKQKSCINDERFILENVLSQLKKGLPARSIGLSTEEKNVIKSMGLLTLKPVIYAININEIDFVFDMDESEKLAKHIVNSIPFSDSTNDMYTVISAKLDAALSETDKNQQIAFLESLGLDGKEHQKDVLENLSHISLPLLVKRLLNLSCVYTGPGVASERSQTTKAHLFQQNHLTALELAGKLHGDIQRGFIKAEVIKASDLMQYASFSTAKTSTEGRDYLIQSNDVVLIKWR
jgi:GTP-binding protein YchF